MEEDEQPMASDVEPDSEVEDGDIEQELGLWLGQLQQDSGVGTKKTMPRAAVTPKMAMDSFRHSIMHTGDGDMDLDALLGELCELETQLTSQQTELECHSASLLPPPGGCEDESRESIESQLQNALSELSDITCAPIGEELEALSFTGAGDRNSGLSDLSSGGTVSAWDGFSDKSRLDTKTSPNRTPVRPPDNVTMTTNHNTQYTSKTAQNQVMSGVQMDGDGQIVMDTTPEGAEADSGFSDTVSLPSSGSHASVATAGSQGSQNSQSSRGSASSGVGLPPSPTPASQMHDVDEVSGQLQSILSVLSKDNLTSAEQAAKLKAEKVRIALEKIKHAKKKKVPTATLR